MKEFHSVIWKWSPSVCPPPVSLACSAWQHVFFGTLKLIIAFERLLLLLLAGEKLSDSLATSWRRRGAERAGSNGWIYIIVQRRQDGNEAPPSQAADAPQRNINDDDKSSRERERVSERKTAVAAVAAWLQQNSTIFLICLEIAINLYRN